MIKKILTCFIMFSLITITGCKNEASKENPAETVIPIEQNTTKKEIQEQFKNSFVGTESNEASGISADNYKNSKFAGYDGKLSFYYNEDGSVLYYKWFINEKDGDKAKEIYSDVCQALSGSYGDGEENNSETSGLYTTSFTNDKQQITAQLQKANDSGYEISYMVVG